MPDCPDTLFLTNPLSGRKKRALGIESSIEAIYGVNHPNIYIQPINFENLSSQLAGAMADGIKNVYAVGGDGTANAVGTRLIDSPINFGIIPTGSGNGYARNIGFSINPRVAIRQTIGAWPQRVDTAIMNDRPFLNIAGVGLGAEVALSYASARTRGLGPYVRSSAEQLLSFSPQTYELTVDGKTRTLRAVLGIEVANGTQWGYNAIAAPLASLTDGMLDLIILYPFPLFDAVGLVGKLFSGQVTKSRHVEVLRGAHIEIRRTAPAIAQIDGEAVPAPSHVRIRVLPASLNLLLPGTLTPTEAQRL